MKFDIESVRSPFNLTTAYLVLREGYPISNNGMDENCYVYSDNNLLFNENDEEVSWDFLKTLDKDAFFFVEVESEECETMDEFGMLEDGEHKNKLSNVENETVNEEDQMNIDNENGKPIENTTKKIEIESMPEKESAITQIQSQRIRDDENGVEEIESDRTPLSENIMSETKKSSGEKSMSQGEGVIQPADSNPYSIALKEENSSSVKLLDDSSRLLINLAKANLDKEMNKAAVLQNTDIAVKCLSEARNLMKTKLEFMKFGNELLRNNK